MEILFSGACQVVFLGIFHCAEIAGIDARATKRAFGEIQFVGCEYFFLATFRFLPTDSDASGRAGFFTHPTYHTEGFAFLVSNEFNMSPVSGGHLHTFMGIMEGNFRFEEFNEGYSHTDDEAPCPGEQFSKISDHDENTFRRPAVSSRLKRDIGIRIFQERLSRL